MGSFDRAQQPAHLRAGQHHGQALRPFRPDCIERRQFYLEDVFVEEQQAAKRLRLRAAGDRFLDGQMRQKLFDLWRAHFPRVPLAVE